MKKAEYKVVSGPEGLPQLEKRVTEYLNKGWKPVGGVGFNAGFPYQAMARIVSLPVKTRNNSESAADSTAEHPLGAMDAMKKLDELT
ncbi:DUF1737 domain-containing protein [Bermanella marisrubri]|uniref:DUF1737 domain-containing protein n=1 Tax=Bermanella marisrubri TaxID=207949 RepID=Q1N3X3_9GAMM|nr:DUF1737 domain-containing protein [Bermanella marisrubri]EAT13092.1 hypothetical protein RED65_15387 [Oceanobacter sp. RED65] [Bermanella marisrubri]QIZ82793.1 DUF1737 domain-containing protein [Bermanella marisrubri]